MTDRWDGPIVRLRGLDPGRVRLHTAVRTVIAAALALLVADAIRRSADLPGGMVVIATVVAVLVSRSPHKTTLAHRLSALVYSPAIGIVAAFNLVRLDALLAHFYEQSPAPTAPAVPPGPPVPPAPAPAAG
jgi:hypothetical protein